MLILRNTQSALFDYRSISSIYRRFLNIKRRNWTSQYTMMDQFFYIAFPERPIYLRRQGLSDGSKSESRISGGTLKRFNKDTLVYLAFPKADNYISSAIQSQALYRKSVVWSDLNFAHCLSFSRNCKQTENESLFKRGVCIYMESKSEVKDSEESMLTFLRESNFNAGKITCIDDQFVWRSISSSESKDEFPLVCVDRKDVTFQDSSCYESPLFTVSEFSPVFHSFQESRNVLEKNSDLPEVVELLEITDSQVCNPQETQLPDHSLKHPFVVVEGMDATGKTTLTQILETKLGAARYYTPPSQIQHLRAFFDKLPEIVRRAYYCMGNYIVAQEIIKECQTRPVIMDRFWHSTTAYGIANETSSGDLPKVGHSVYKWPSDLLKPTLVLFLTVSEDVRKQRLSDRGIVSTFEEKSLDKDQLFRQRLCDSYRRMEEPACFEIDASGTVEEVSGLAQKALQQHRIQLDKKTTALTGEN